MGTKNQLKIGWILGMALLLVPVLLLAAPNQDLKSTQTLPVLHRRTSAFPTPNPHAQKPSVIKKITVEDRWHIAPPPHEINVKSPLGKLKVLDPYNQNKLKGDYPLIGQKTFLILTAQSQTVFESKKLPVPSGASAAGPGRRNFFGNGNLLAAVQHFKLSAEIYHGNTAYKPRDWQLKMTPVFNINHLTAQERGVVKPDVRRGKTRTELDLALEEAFAEAFLGAVSARYDFISIRGGIQPFTSDLRGFIFSDTNLGGRLFGNFGNNKYQWNLAGFDLLEKNANSGLNTFARREQEVLVASLFKQDFFGRPGWTNQFNLVWDHDQASTQYDVNGNLVRPDPAGAATPRRVDAVYTGWTSDGHIGRFNVAHAFYLAMGQDQKNLIAGRKTNIFGQMAALELSYDRDWYRLKSSFFYASGDDNPRDDKAHGFDAVFDSPKFAGGDDSFFQHQAIKLGGVNLTQADSFLVNLRSSKNQGQANFVNPGIFLANVGIEADVLQQFKASVNANYLYFMETAPLELLLNQANIRNEIGWDVSLGLEYRPFLNNNMVVKFNGATFVPGGGFRDMLTNHLLYQAFTNVVFTY